MFNNNMEKDDKIKRFAPRKIKSSLLQTENKFAEIKNFLGFEYIKLEKDVNGISFNKKSLNDFAQNLKYTISVMREKSGKVYLYEYFVPDCELKKFLEAYVNGTILGEIIQIKSHTPDNLA